jgi:hypothetical protein
MVYPGGQIYPRTIEQNYRNASFHSIPETSKKPLPKQISQIHLHIPKTLGSKKYKQIIKKQELLQNTNRQTQKQQK